MESMRLFRRAAARKIAHIRPQGWTREASSSTTMRVPIIGEWVEKEGAVAASPTLQPTAAVPAVQGVQVVLESGSWMGLGAGGSDSRVARPGIRVAGPSPRGCIGRPPLAARCRSGCVCASCACMCHRARHCQANLPHGSTCRASRARASAGCSGLRNLRGVDIAVRPEAGLT